jgi:hypothetical protein
MSDAAMKLASIRYIENQGTPAAWELESLIIGPTNLLIGKNAAGKTRVLSAMRRVADLLSSRGSLGAENALWEVHWNNNQPREYLLRQLHGRVAEERLTINGQAKLTRGAGGIGRIWAEQIKSDLDFQSPDSCLAVCSRQDSIQHPFLAPLETWAKSVHSYSFTSIGRANLSERPAEILYLNRDHAGFFEDLRKDLGVIGYEVEEIGLTEANLPQTGQKKLPEVFVKEKRLKTITRQHVMSQGMYRSLSLLVCLNHLQLARHPACVLIDDFGEGLDFERVGALTDLTVSKCRESGFQLILSTNERVVMNKIPLEYWSVLLQEEGRTRIFNQANARERFDNFKFTGLSNFDFFSMDFAGDQTHE